MIRDVTRCTAVALAACLLVPACADPELTAPTEEVADDNPFASGEDFAMIPRAVAPAVAATRQLRLAAAGAPAEARAVTSQDFLLAIRRSALRERWFLSAYVDQFFPGGVRWLGANWLNTRVVSFRIQNGKLFVMNADDRARESDTFDAERIIEAYPIVEVPAIARLSGASDYVVFDPTAGLNRFNEVSDYFAQEPNSTELSIDLVLLKDFQRLADGMAYQQVFTGYASGVVSSNPLLDNQRQASGTLSISLRRYAEGSHFTKVAAPAQPHYFLGAPRHVTDAGRVERPALHWDIYPGMKPIEWVISPSLAQLDATPEYADIDLVGVVIDGVESWNRAFGFPVFRARLARNDEPRWRDDLNYILFDSDPTVGFAFASFRHNPNTGEIRGGSVYFNRGWVNRSRFSDDPPPPAARPALPALRWGGASGEPLCVLWADEAHASFDDGPGRSMTGAEKLARYLGQMITHEIGHHVGLRHNFKGSLMPPSSSVMEYVVRADRVVTGANPLPYDIDAVRYLYGLSPELPQQPFCTDEHYFTGTDPDCRPSDRGAEPITDWWRGVYDGVRAAYLQGGSTDPAAAGAASGLLEYAGVADAPRASLALELLLAGIAAPLDPANAADPAYAAGADTLVRWILLGVTPKAPGVAAVVDRQIGLVLANADGVRSFTTRRALVDLLKKRQTVGAYRLLVTARAEIAASLTTAPLDPDALLQTQDLLQRIDAAITPYFL